MLGVNRTLACLTIILVLCFSATASSSAENPAERQLLVTVSPQEDTLQNVLKSISEQTEWTIIFDENLANTLISGDFSEVPFDTFLKRALKGQNLIVVYDDQNRSVEVRSFAGQDQPQMIVDADGINPFPTDKEEQQILANQKREDKIYEEYQNNPDSIEPLTGMTLGEITALQAREQEIFDAYQNDPQSKEPVSGVTLGEIATLKEYEDLVYEEYRNNPDSIEPLTGMTLGEIAALRKARQKAK